MKCCIWPCRKLMATDRNITKLMLQKKKASLVLGMVLMLLTVTVVTHAEDSRAYRVGVLMLNKPDRPHIQALREGLKKLDDAYAFARAFADASAASAARLASLTITHHRDYLRVRVRDRA